MLCKIEISMVPVLVYKIVFIVWKVIHLDIILFRTSFMCVWYIRRHFLPIICVTEDACFMYLLKMDSFAKKFTSCCALGHLHAFFQFPFAIV